MNQNSDVINYGKSLFSMVPKWIDKISINNNELVLHCIPKNLINLLFFLKNYSNSQYNQLMDITSVDFPNKKNRFEVVYILLSTIHNSRIKVKTFTNEIHPIPSVTNLYNSANWYEREV